ncbi:hypothetical protein Trydic_g7559 [Trypoxylus dichotomus]
METKGTDPVLKSMLANTGKSTPAVPVPDWSTPLGGQLGVSTQTNPSNMTVSIPGSATNDPFVNITLQNCVATVDLGCELNLMTINSRTRNSEYNPARFGGVIMRIREPRTTALIFKTGKIICTGARNEQDALLASKKFTRILQKLNFNVKFTNYKIQNIVASCDLRFPIKLENLNQMHGQFSSYEPEVFPGLVYRMVKPRLVLLIFVNGKVLFTGTRQRTDFALLMENITLVEVAVILQR